MLRLPAWILLTCALPLAGQPPAFYKETPRLMWVVRDAQATADAWERAGIPHDGDMEPYTAAQVVRRGGEPDSYKFSMLSGYFANLRVDWFQPGKGDSSWKSFLDKHGPGVFGLMFRVPELDDLTMEAARLQSLGVDRLEEGVFVFDQGWKAPYVMMDTGREGKFVLCLYYDPSPDPAPDSRGPQVARLGLLAKDLDHVSAYWAKLGLAPIGDSHTEIRERTANGQTARFEVRLAYQRQFPVEMEWIQPMSGPSIYDEQLAKQGEGFQHLAFQASDLETESARWQDLGFPATMSGAWGEKGATGSGRFAFHDLHAAGGLDVELLWNYKASAAVRSGK